MSYFVFKIRHLGRPPFLQSYILCELGVQMSGVQMSYFVSKIGHIDPRCYSLIYCAILGVQMSGVPNVGGPDVGGPDVGGQDVGGPDVGGLDVGGPDVGGPDVGGPDVGGPDVRFLFLEQAVKVGYILKFIKFTYSS